MADPIRRITVTKKDDKTFTRKLFTIWLNDNGMLNVAPSKESNQYDITLADFIAEGGPASFFMNERDNKSKEETTKKPQPDGVDF